MLRACNHAECHSSYCQYDGTTRAAEPSTPEFKLDELLRLARELDTLRPRSMTEGEVMRLLSYASKLGEQAAYTRGYNDGRAAAVAEMREAVKG